MKKAYTLMFIMTCFGNIISCQSQVQKKNITTLDSTWKEVQYNKIYFKYPSDWFYEKEEINGTIRLTVTPDSLKRFNTLRAFEIIEINPKGRTFTQFKKDFIYTASSRANAEAKVIKKEIIVFKNYETIYAELIQDYKVSPIPTKVYGINAGNRFYMIFIISRLINNSPESKMDTATSEILKSLKLLKK